MFRFPDGNGFFADQRCRDWGCREDKRIESVVGKNPVEGLHELFPQFERTKIARSGDLGAHFEAHTYILPIFTCVLREPARLLVIVSCLRPGDLIPGVFGFGQLRDGHFLEASAKLLHHAKGRLKSKLDIRIQHIEEKLFGNTQSRPALARGRKSAGNERTLFFPFHRDCVEKKSGVLHCARQRADNIERLRQRNHVFWIYAADSRLEPDNAAKRSRNADGSTGIRSDASVTKASCQRRRRTATRASRDAFGIPGIARGAIVGILRGDTVGKLMHVGFAQNDRSRILQRGNYRGVVKRHKVVQDLGATRRANARGVDVVFERNGNTMKRPAVAPAFSPRFDAKLGLSPYGLLGRSLFANREIGVEFGVEFVNAIQKKARELNGRELALTEEFANFGNRSENELRICGLQKILSCRRRLPKVPILARIKATRNWFSERTVARLKCPYSTESPQQPPL